MTFLKSLWSDLVEKRLWPVALALVLALVAVPVLLGGGAEEPVAAVGVTGATGAGPLNAQVALDVETPLRRDRLGKLRDPFEQAAEVAAQAATGATGPAAAGATSPSSSPLGATATPSPGVGGSGGLTPSPPQTPAPQTPAPQTPAPQKGAAPAADPRDAYAAVLRFGTTGSKRPVRRVERLTPLPSPENPAFVYLGVAKGSDKVVLLLSSDAKATGDGACVPNKTSCESVELAPGDTEFFDVTAEDGKVTRYQLDLQRIDKSGASAPRRGTAAGA